MNYAFHPEALDEFEAAAKYYADRQPGLEIRFIACVETALRQICGEPMRWRIFENDIRRCLVHVFPFAVLFTIESEQLFIIAVMHTSRAPGYWLHRLK